MVQRENTNDAALKDAQVSLKREVCAKGMEQMLNTNGATLKDAQALLKREDCALSMGQRSNDAASKVAQINPNEEEYVTDTVHTATPLMNLQLSHRVSDQNLIRLLCLILIMVRQQAKGVYLKRLPSV